jgi:hypothetical protein|tara:strand:- start:85 stop:363 length:279 start_codon:yes stop_codon:yes gene_type:complete
MSSKSHECIAFVNKLVKYSTIYTFEPLHHKRYALELIMSGITTENFAWDDSEVSSLDSQCLRVINLDLVDGFDGLELALVIPSSKLDLHELL